MTTLATNRLQALDALRGLAATIVVLFHYVPYYHQLYGHDFEPWDWLAFGRYGVHLFFMLSGFVILMTLTRTPGPGWFALARGFRLLPALWAGIAITMTSVALLGPTDRAVSLTDALVNMTLLHEYLGLPHVDGAYWSLVIEITFYVWIGLAFYGLGQGRRLTALLWLWVLISYVGVVYWRQLPSELEFLVKDLLFVRYAPLFVSGMLLYRWYQQGPLPWGQLLLLVLAIGHCLMAYRAPFSFFVLGCYGVFILAIAGRLDWLANAPLLWLGRLSYPFYLVHQNLGYGVIGWSYGQDLPGLVGVGLALALALACAWLINVLVERPALRWFQSRRRARLPERAWPSETVTVQTARN